MSHDTFIGVPGLTPELAEELDRRADLAGAPFESSPGRSAGRRRDERGPSVTLVGLRADPSLASETLDHEHRWPQSTEVRDWLVRAVGFLAANVPKGRFSFFSGWIEHHPQSTVGLTLGEFLERIANGSLRSDEQYDVRVGPVS